MIERVKNYHCIFNVFSVIHNWKLFTFTLLLFGRCVKHEIEEHSCEIPNYRPVRNMLRGSVQRHLQVIKRHNIEKNSFYVH